MDEAAMKVRLNALKSFIGMVEAGQLPKGKVIMARQLDLPIDRDRPGIWTDDPEFTAKAFWKQARYMWERRENAPPGLTAALEHAVSQLETIQWWVKEYHSK